MPGRRRNQQQDIDPIIVESNFARGIVRDLPRHMIPPGGLYDSQDFLLEKPGLAYKRGGWSRHSAAMGAAAGADAVATIHIPTRVVGVAGGNLYNVTSEGSPQADVVGACPAPAENPPYDPSLKALIFTYPDSSAAPKKVYWTGSAIAVANLDGSPPGSGRSTLYAGRIVLARGMTSSGNLNRIWFSNLDHTATWNSSLMYLDVDVEIIGLCPVSGVLGIFGVNAVQRILGTIPPGTDPDIASDMELQPVASVGCLDARSIVRRGNEVIFAGEEGVFITNMSGVQSLTDKADRSGISSYWRSLFPSGHARQITAGLLYQDYYIVSILDDVNGFVDTLLCHVPTQGWTRLTNIQASMFAQGRTEDETLDLYWSATNEPRVNRMRTILEPSGTTKLDGNGVAVAPLLETRALTQGGVGLVEYGHAKLTYDMRDIASDDPILAASTAKGFLAPTFTASADSPLTETTDMTRKRFRVNMESQALTVRFAQTRASSKTEVAMLEVETRDFGQTGEGPL